MGGGLFFSGATMRKLGLKEALWRGLPMSAVGETGLIFRDQGIIGAL